MQRREVSSSGSHWVRAVEDGAGIPPSPFQPMLGAGPRPGPALPSALPPELSRVSGLQLLFDALSE